MRSDNYNKPNRPLSVRQISRRLRRNPVSIYCAIKHLGIAPTRERFGEHLGKAENGCPVA
jgi:hypothetical protein